jgi:glycosyltransferase involved in cell wall biosynthesis
MGDLMDRVIPFVSVVIPTHNRRELLKATLESLFEQSYPKDRYEIIVADNASTDGTEEMIQSLNADAPCALEYFRKGDEGPGVARNVGIEKARGSIIAFTEDDCIADPHWLENGVAMMGDGVGLVQGKTIPNPDQTIRSFSRTQKVVREDVNYETFNIFYRKDVIDLVGGFSADFIGLDRFGKPMMGGEDIDLAWSVKKLGWKSVFADDAIIYHHVFSVSPWKVIFSYRRCQLMFFVLPYIVKKHKELRSYFYLRFFLTRNRALFDLFILSALSGVLIHQGFLLLIIPYIALRMRDIFKGRPLKAYHHNLSMFIIYGLRDLIDFILLAFGSIWYRTIVL